MRQKLIIIGTEGTARNIIEQISDAIGNHGYDAEIAGLVIDIYPAGTTIAGFPVLAGTDNLTRLAEDKSFSFLFALFKPEKMEERYEMLMS
mgnify:FL=1